MRATILILGLAAHGCIESSLLVCDPGFVQRGQECVAVQTVDAAADPTDAMMPDVPGETDAGSCEATCALPMRCDDEERCVECLSDEQCAAPTAVCAAGACAECAQSADCLAPDNAACRAGVCSPCAMSDDCVGVAAGDILLNLCVEEMCVAGCREESAEVDCGAFACNPTTMVCTETPRGTLQTCMPCVADSECAADHACVGMEWAGEAREGGFCLKQLDSGCEEPYAVATPPRESLSGREASRYCGINEMMTSCEAVIHLITNEDCETDDDCGVFMGDGLCRVVNGIADRCTISCSGEAQCPLVAATCDTYCGNAGASEAD